MTASTNISFPSPHSCLPTRIALQILLNTKQQCSHMTKIRLHFIMIHWINVSLHWNLIQNWQTNYTGCLKSNKLVVLNVCNHLQTTTNEMIPTCNVTGVLVQDSMVNGRLLLPILKAFTHCTQSLNTCQNAWYLQTVAPSNSSTFSPKNKKPPGGRHLPSWHP